MTTSKTIELYDDEYAHGYMDQWPAQTRERVCSLLRRLPLGATGNALDFGCGNGFFTDVLSTALPGWKVYGTEISGIALANCRKRFPDCTFLNASELGDSAIKFDLLFTHHVLEHVDNLSETAEYISTLLGPNAHMLHILPCGNAGSLEHSVCMLVRNGIDPAHENRFFYEPDIHLRRLRTEDLQSQFGKHGFSLVSDYYRCHNYAAVDYYTQQHPRVILSFLNPANAIDSKARRKLTLLRYAFLAIWILRFPAFLFENKLEKRAKSVRDYIYLAICLLAYPASKPFDFIMKWLAEREWARRNKDRAGAEMYLLFKRT